MALLVSFQVSCGADHRCRQFAVVSIESASEAATDRALRGSPEAPGHDGATMAAMNAHIRSSVLPLAAAMTTWVVAVASLVAMLVFDLRLSAAGRSDLQQFLDGSVLFTHPRPERDGRWIGAGYPATAPSGRLAVSVCSRSRLPSLASSTSTPPTGRSPDPARCRARSWPRSSAPRTYIPWLMLLGLILLLTPSGRLTGRFTRFAAWTTWLAASSASPLACCAPMTATSRRSESSAIRSRSLQDGVLLRHRVGRDRRGPPRRGRRCGCDCRAVSRGAGRGTAATALARDGGDPVRRCSCSGRLLRRC